MRRFNPNLPLSVSQIRTTFADSLGNVRKGMGTGFFINWDSVDLVFVTNKHNLVPMAPLFEGDYTLKMAELTLRHVDGGSIGPGRFVEFDLGQTELVHSGSADVSLIVAPIFKRRLPREEAFRMNGKDSIADEDFLRNKVELMDFVSFIGFPGKSNSPWWDLGCHLPIARLASIASMPHLPFSNPGIKTGDVTLISGLSFTGSSGSPVILHPKGRAFDGSANDPAYIPPKVIGIASGHWQERAEPEMLRHSGLSYFTRSTSILELLAKLPAKVER